MRIDAIMAFGAITLATGFATAAHAQEGDFERLMAMDLNSLEGEIQSRYDAGLATSLDEAIIGSDDSRYLWALEAKVQCGIALGYLKSSTRDETSIRNCQRAHALMSYVPSAPVAPVAPPPPQPPRQTPSICNDDVVGIVFFEFDSAQVSTDAAATLDTVIANIPVCGWQSLQIVGHTDQAGSDAYNIDLSRARADAVEAAFRARGVGGAMMRTSAQGESNPRVPLPDGTRSPQNRRVEISAE